MTAMTRTTLGDVRRFAFWEDPGGTAARGYGFEDGILPDDVQVVVDERLRVHLPGSRTPLAADRRSDWALFCQENYGLRSDLWPHFERHPLNENFTWDPIGETGRRILTEAEAHQYNEQGYVMLEDVFDKGFLQRLTDELDEHDARRLATLRRTGNAEAEKRMSFGAQPSRRLRMVQQLCVLPLFQHLGHDIIGPDVRLYWDQSVYKPARCSDPFPWHQDTGYTFVDYEQLFTVWIALTDVDVESGCLRVLPGGHRVGTLRHHRSEFGNYVFGEDPKGMTPVPMKAGSMAVFTATLPHMTGGNDRGWTRKAIMMEYAPDGMQRIALDPWGRQVKTPANYMDSHYLILKDGVPVEPSL